MEISAKAVRSTLFVVVSIALLVSSSSYATLVNFEFSGTVTESQDNFNLLSGGFRVGDSFTGTVSYDTEQSLPPASQGVYYFFSSAQITVNSSGHTIFGTTHPSSPSCWPSPVNCIEPFNVSVTDNGLAEGDRLAYSAAFVTYDGQSLPGNPTHSNIQLALHDTLTQTAINSLELPALVPELSLFNNHDLHMFADGPNLLDPSLYSFWGNITAISPVTVVPEPGTFVLLGTGLVILLNSGWRSRKRTA